MTTIKSILVALHGSNPDSASHELAVAWAQRTGAEVTGLAVVDETVAEPAAVPIGGGAFKQEEETELLSERQRLAHVVQQAFAGRCRAAKVKFRVDQRAGVPHEIVADELQGHDVAVVDNQPPVEYGAGESPAQVLERLIRVSPRPIVSSPRDYHPGNGVLVAFDGSAPAAKAIFGLLGSGLGAFGRVRILTVDKDSEESARSRAQSGIDYLRRHEIDTGFQPVVSDRPVSELICEEADRQRCELIVMGPHGRSAFAELFLGSVTKKVIDHSGIPVFLYH